MLCKRVSFHYQRVFLHKKYVFQTTGHSTIVLRTYPMTIKQLRRKMRPKIYLLEMKLTDAKFYHISSSSANNVEKEVKRLQNNDELQGSDVNQNIVPTEALSECSKTALLSRNHLMRLRK
ncbi:hypothetical protein NQ317_008437 [Molorchus minor]|uniref:Uncharacterized protein n=1 Tax=Molorchus minor TaxID=1323400 RepID=A0ABQ9JD70_9CUCU|nr:hypothetical protein NQ317_008437 [Molorchus minor]